MATPGRNNIIIPGQSWTDFAIPIEFGRPRGWIIDPPKSQANSDAGKMRTETPRQLIWCRSNGINRPTTRFLAYRVCGALGLPHTKVDQAEDIIVELRRTHRGGIAMGAVRDARSTIEEPWCVEPANAASRAKSLLDALRADRQEGQPYRVVFVTEADGSVPFFQTICDAYGVALYSGGGSVPLSLVARLWGEARTWFEKTKTPTVILCMTDLDLMGLKNIFMPFARDIEMFAAQEGAPQAVIVRRIGVTPDQVLDHLPQSVRQAGFPTGTESWWPMDRNGDYWILPTAEALLDVLPGILEDHLKTLMPRERKRKNVIATEAGLRQLAAEELRLLL